MRFSHPLIEGRLIQRYKRFLADVELNDGTQVTAHCANPGAMLGLTKPGSKVFLSPSTNPARKLSHSWEIVEMALEDGLPRLAGINTSLPNKLVAEALENKAIPELDHYTRIRSEVPYGKQSRVDFLLETEGAPPCYLEIKNVHLMREAGLAEFPDCKAARSARHMLELADMVETGARAVALFVIQMNADRFRSAYDIDPAFGKALDEAKARGVEILAYTCRLSPQEIILAQPVPVLGRL